MTGLNSDKNPDKKPAKKRYAIPDRVADIALRYGYNVSRGIQSMEKVIIELRGKLEGKHGD